MHACTDSPVLQVSAHIATQLLQLLCSVVTVLQDSCQPSTRAGLALALRSLNAICMGIPALADGVSCCLERLMKLPSYGLQYSATEHAASTLEMVAGVRPLHLPSMYQSALETTCAAAA